MYKNDGNFSQLLRRNNSISELDSHSMERKSSVSSFRVRKFKMQRITGDMSVGELQRSTSTPVLVIPRNKITTMDN